MSRLADEVSWDLDCPECKKQFKATLAELDGDPILTCPHCGQKIQIESGGTARETAKQIDDLDRAWNNLLK